MRFIERKDLKIGDLFSCPKNNFRSVVINTTLHSFDYLTEYTHNTLPKNEEKVLYLGNVFSSKFEITEV